MLELWWMEQSKGGWVRRVAFRILSLKGLWDIRVQPAIGLAGINIQKADLSQ